ncbi:hypothetical protein [Mesorhizobium sp. B2-3-12]|uniref:hypothetical protein n=1 Tax=Mesorhizobium sp. B2-3-12 TaxID=2589952 RepID=UPI0011281ED6|nr:hypothetical protein [Mesorhizobium sp. B2-3-12]TPL88678.1 hypothetical protein FJ948_20905 [Mesorhizobium sp. B2-3-12]
MSTTIQDHFSKTVCYYEKALSIQDRIVEHEREKGRPVEQDELLLESMRESLKVALKALRRVDGKNHFCWGNSDQFFMNLTATP